MNTLASGQRTAAPTALLNPGAPLWLATLIACLASFMVVMDGAIVNVALPAMARDLGLDAGSRQWVVDAYLVALGGLMLLAARLADRLGRRRVLRAGLALFSLASLVGGLVQGRA
ncbi:MFS transporter, partial [Metapseudomonas otitidis]|uniref:MFS transporter n=1 Tax=Metapseudomonas otitidis TaxID=319939 RepID=UPI00197E11FC